MVFHTLLALVLAAPLVHLLLEHRGEPDVGLLPPASRRERAGELILLYVLVGYCGIPMVGVSVAALVQPERAAEILGFPAGNPFQHFAMVAYLGMSLQAVLALRYRGRYLIGPALCWSVFFLGATVIHLADFASRGHLDHEHALAIFVTHGLVSVVLMGGLALSGLPRRLSS